MIQNPQATTGTLPQSLEEFLRWESETGDGFKYEWNDGEIIGWSSLQTRHLYIYQQIVEQFYDSKYGDTGTLINKVKIHLNAVQVRLPDTAYFTDKQIREGSRGMRIIPGFVIEYISGQDRYSDLEQKFTEYFGAGVQVIWVIMPEQQKVYVHTSPRDVKACIEDDICSAAPVLPKFEISVNDMLVLR